MAGEIANFGNKRNSNGFDKNPQNIVPGRPKKGVALINDDLKKMGITPLTPSQLDDIMKNLMQLSQDEVKALSKRKDLPFLVWRCLKDLTGANGQRALNDVLNRAFGMPKQKVETENKTKLELTAEQEKEVKALRDSILDSNL